MSNSRSVIVKEMETFLNFRSVSEDFFSAKSKSALLQRIKENYLKLSSEEKKNAVMQLLDLFETGLTSPQKKVLNYMRDSFLKTSIAGITGGWLMGSSIGMLVSKSMLMQGLIELGSMGAGVYGAVGYASWMIAAKRYPDVDILHVKNRFYNVNALLRLVNSLEKQAVLHAGAQNGNSLPRSKM